MNAVLAAGLQDTVAIVSRRTVIGLLAAQVNGRDPLPLWRTL